MPYIILLNLNLYTTFFFAIAINTNSIFIICVWFIYYISTFTINFMIFTIHLMIILEFMFFFYIFSTFAKRTMFIATIVFKTYSIRMWYLNLFITIKTSYKISMFFSRCIHTMFFFMSSSTNAIKLMVIFIYRFT